MKKICFTFIFGLVLNSSFGQSPAKLLSYCDFVITNNAENKPFNLIMISDARCGYSQLAMENLIQLTELKNLTIHIVDFGEKDKKDLYHKKYASAFNFIKPTNCLVNKAPDFFPQFVLYDETNKVVWQNKGWFDKNLEIIKTKVAIKN